MIYPVASGGTPGGSSGQVQYNNAGAFGGAAALAYATSSTHLTVTSQAAGDVGVLVKAHASQSADSVQWQTSAGAVRARVTSGGYFSNYGVPGSGANHNEMFGDGAGAALQSGAIRNVFAGMEAGGQVTTGSYNVCVGWRAGWSITTHNQNTLIGNEANVTGTPNGVTVIGSNATATSDAIAIGKDAVANVRGIVIGMSSTLNSVQGMVCGLNATQRNAGDLTWCWDTGSSTTSGLLLQGRSSTSTTRDTFRIAPAWATATDASRKARAVFEVYDTAARECLRLEASGTAAMIGFLGASAVARYATTGTVTGHTGGGGTALTHSDTFTGNSGATAYTIGDIVLALKNYGLLTA